VNTSEIENVDSSLNYSGISFHQILKSLFQNAVSLNFQTHVNPIDSLQNQKVFSRLLHLNSIWYRLQAES